MRNKFLRAGFFVFACALPYCLTAMDWPSSDAKLIRNFGWNDRGSPVLGTVFEGEGYALAVEDGELIFHNSGKNAGLPSPLGTWAAIDHGDGLLSIYSRLDDNSEHPPVKVEKNAPVAGAGLSGWSETNGFYFMLYDRRERRWVNPSMIISHFPDTRPPQIVSVELRNSRGAPVSSAGLWNLVQGRYTITVHTVDTMLNPNDPPLAPYRIISSVNGTEVGSLNFETISARDGRLMAMRGGPVPARQIYAPFPAFEAGEVLLSRGQATLEVIVQDIAGNSRNALIRMRVE